VLKSMINGLSHFILFGSHSSLSLSLSLSLSPLHPPQKEKISRTVLFSAFFSQTVLYS